MKRAAVAAAAALATLVAVPVLAVGQGMGSPAARDGKTLRVTEKIADSTTLDLGKEGPSPGDRISYTSEVTRSGRRMGNGIGECSQYAGDSEETAKYYCTQAFSLARGQIFVAGLVDPARTVSAWAVTGGTGLYRGASGQLNVTKTAPETFTEVFRFAE